MNITKEEMLETLQNSIAMVSFTKKDGTLRDMQCTLRSDLLPTKTETTKTPKSAPSTDAIAVYDLEKLAWRAFNLSNVISYSTIVA